MCGSLIFRSSPPRAAVRLFAVPRCISIFQPFVPAAELSSHAPCLPAAAHRSASAHVPSERHSTRRARTCRASGMKD